jgi:hypothetical protein
MIFPAAGLDGLTSLDVQQPGPLIDHLLKMPHGQSLPFPLVDENVPLLPVAYIMPQHLAALIQPVSFMVLGMWRLVQRLYLPLVLGKVISPVVRFHSSILTSRTSLGLVS